MCKFLITDEIIMAAAHQFAAMGIRAGEADDTELHIGNIGVILCDDFAHLRPIGKRPNRADLGG